MTEVDKDYIDDIGDSEAEGNVTLDAPCEPENVEAATNDKGEGEKTLTSQNCASDEELTENDVDEPLKFDAEAILAAINEIKVQNEKIITALQELNNDEKVYERYQQNLDDFRKTFELFESQLPQVVTQLRTELKTGPGTDYKNIIQEAAQNYANLKSAISKDIKKAVETWNNVRSDDKAKRKNERLLILVAAMQVTIFMMLFIKFYKGA